MCERRRLILLAARLAAAATLVTAAGASLAVASAGAAAKAHLVGSRAVAPVSAPQQVKDMIAAGNRIRRKPYVWGGGHGSWTDNGYDCSGAVSYVLHGAGLLGHSLDSTGFMSWGRAGANRWATVYAHHGHAYMVVAGLRWDTSYITDGDPSGPGWSTAMRDSSGFRARHPAGSGGW